MEEALLAKSPVSGKSPKTLVEHTKDVMQSVELLFGCKEGSPTRLAREWLRFFRLEREYYGEFFANTLAAAACHDIGKANDGFQKAVRNKGDQKIRHEHLSGLLMSLPDFRQWFDHNPLLDFDVILSSVISHHVKVDPDIWCQPVSASGAFRILTDKKDFRELLEVIQRKLDLPAFQLDIDNLSWNFGKASHFFDYTDLLESANDRAYRFGKKVKQCPKLFSLLCSVKAALLAADSSGSGVTREGHDLSGWLRKAFIERLPLRDGDIRQKIIEPRIDDIGGNVKGSFELQDFQKKASELGERSLLIAPCGSGKTLAAWLWIEARLKKKPTTRVIFLYPTRATATEGFRDYVSWAPEEDAALVHGTATYDLKDMFENPQDQSPQDPRTGKDFTTEQRLFALRFWQKSIFSATADQFLSFIQNQYSSLCLLPLLVDSVIVVDEIHSFDKAMFSAFSTFLKKFDVPVLSMTATLSKDRRSTLVHECGMQLFPETLEGLEDLEQRAQHPRYHLQTVSSHDNAEKEVRKAIKEKKKVLWVTNQVRACQDVARRFSKEKALCYHSRFRLVDRRERHRSVIKAFQTHMDFVLAVTTQVCEMSLDLDADVLVTESAPISALIQRMGRCNRKGKVGDGRCGKVYVYPPKNDLPYESEEIEDAKEFIGALEGKDLSQSDLEQAMEKHQSAQHEPEKFSNFIEGGSYAMSRSYRENSGEHTVRAVLDRDINEWHSLKEREKLIVPVPRRYAIQNRSLGRFLMEAPGANYDPDYGFLDSPTTN